MWSRIERENGKSAIDRPKSGAILCSASVHMNCTPPAIDDFPRDLFTEEQRQNGAVVLHAIASLYLFVALAVVCDKYFVPAVEKICQALNMSNDVAGATFMAAATSAPELFVNVIGTFITEGDIGVGTIVGSAVFNILAVAACCGIGAGMVVPLDWWPLTRDCLAYGITVAILICIIHDERVEWYEALILVLLYIVYIAVMYYDKSFQKCAREAIEARAPLRIGHFQQNGNLKNVAHADAAAAELTSASAVVDVEMQIKPSGDLRPAASTTATTIVVEAGPTGPAIQETPMVNAREAREANGTLDADEAPERPPPPPSPVTPPAQDLDRSEESKQNGGSNGTAPAANGSDTSSDTVKERSAENGHGGGGPSADAVVRALESGSAMEEPNCPGGNEDTNAAGENGNGDNGGDDDDDEEFRLLSYPLGKSAFTQFYWIITWPIHLLFMFTIPNCEKPRFRNWFPLTFTMCIVWIGSLSYVVAWMITIIGDTLKIPDSVMGITFLAAGTSVPEAVSSVIVAKQGHGSMGISNSIGSNTFDILLCLGLPWFIKAAFSPIKPGHHWVGINSAGLEYSAISLLSTLLMLYIAFSLNKFKLDRRVGNACLIMYAVFLILASLIELNVFFRVNLPTCGR
ncbi:sodium/potassium/calcium exchanger 4-like isoform X3 [Anopheles albimanus]|uniref:sodium/potassium/calcium exchanger 4-like isoform X3 n=1 Tax=Anopheles albimanus TaxID=7167 RepID=UPI0016421E6F|nr:sodium/potassium/calcium exchanger 4-like isoform X3 [Anopheles albimanus]